MKTFRENPDGSENQKASRDNEQYIKCLKWLNSLEGKAAHSGEDDNNDKPDDPHIMDVDEFSRW